MAAPRLPQVGTSCAPSCPLTSARHLWYIVRAQMPPLMYPVPLTAPGVVSFINYKLVSTCPSLASAWYFRFSIHTDSLPCAWRQGSFCTASQQLSPCRCPRAYSSYRHQRNANGEKTLKPRSFGVWGGRTEKVEAKKPNRKSAKCAIVQMQIPGIPIY